MKKTSTIISVVVSAIVAVPVVFFYLLLAALTGLKSAWVVIVTGVLFIGLVGSVTFSISNKHFYKLPVFLLLALTVISFFTPICENYYKNIYIPSIRVTQNTFYWRKYLPFTDSPYLYRLSETSTLKFSSTDELPRLDGATALYPVYSSFAENVYPSEIEPKKYIEFSTTIGAYNKLIEGRSDIIFTAGASQEQLEMAQENGVELNFTPIGYEAFVFIVNKKNPVESIKMQEVRDIYSGKITNWKELGGKNREIRPFQRDKNSGSQTAFLKIFGDTENLLPAETHEVFDMEGLINVVSDYENHGNALGYSFRYYVETNQNSQKIKMLKLNGIEPTVENIKNRSYPITDNFYAVTVKGRESENTKKLIDWILSPQGQEIIEQVGYVPLY